LILNLIFIKQNDIIFVKKTSSQHVVVKFFTGFYLVNPSF